MKEVYMSPSLGFDAQFGQQMCKLQKSLYGLKQSPRVWFDRFTTFVKSPGFEIKDLENLKYFLEMEVPRSKEGISVSQKKYTLDLLTDTGMLGCRLADTPIEFNCKLGNSNDQVLVDEE